MSLSSPQQAVLEKHMRLLCDELDHHLEDAYGERYPLHPNRPARGKAARVAYDGLFSTGTKFTLGYGSTHGRGYLVDIEISTLERVKAEDREEIESTAIKFLREKLPEHFPDRKLEVVKDGKVYKIVGDFSLGKLY
ncbi:MAG: hypothetical protein PHR90_03660 [Sphaerochaetaceae bacterium]|nr:hypothetical protein [Sphaerochaetaceae bacterium]